MRSLFAALAGAALLSTAALAASPEGIWMSEDGGLKVELSECGGKLCGRVVWLGEPLDQAGKPKTDRLNPDPGKRDRPLIGLEVVHGMAPAGPDRWSGVIYNADDGHTYRANLHITDERTAVLEGCILKLLCMGHTWTRVASPLEVTNRRAERAR
jgi:uncharacterized protein (DUF2147 family)